MEVKHQDNENKGAFTAYEGEVQAGEMTYSWAGPNRFIIDHTEVDAAFGGQGVGLKMVLAAVEFAREKQVKILPLCPFAKSVFDKKSELGDVL